MTRSMHTKAMLIGAVMLFALGACSAPSEPLKIGLVDLTHEVAGDTVREQLDRSLERSLGDGDQRRAVHR